MIDNKPKKTRRKIFYRVSVFDEKLNKYLVKKCSLKLCEAIRLVDKYTAGGEMALFLPCIND